MQLDSKLCTCRELKALTEDTHLLKFSLVMAPEWSWMLLHTVSISSDQGLISACFHNGAPEKALQALEEVKSLPNCDGSGLR